MTEEMSARQELEELAEIYREADTQEKDWKAAKTEIRGPLLELMSEVVREEVPLAKRTEIVTDEELARCGGDYETWRARNFPEWNLVGIMPEPSERQAKVTLEEDDQLKKFTFTVNGHKYGRTFKLVGGHFRAEEFRAEVAQRDDITRPLLAKLLETVKVETKVEYTFDEEAAIALMADHPELTAIFQEYTAPGTPQVSLLPIKAVKETEE